jgi:hypothetical protein
VDQSRGRKAITASVIEPSTGLHETLTFSVANGSAALQTDVSITNPKQDTVNFAHWTNVPMVPGGENELPDDTVFDIPTPAILVAERWQSNLGPSPQHW